LEGSLQICTQTRSFQQSSWLTSLCRYLTSCVSRWIFYWFECSHARPHELPNPVVEALLTPMYCYHCKTIFSTTPRPRLSFHLCSTTGFGCSWGLAWEHSISIEDSSWKTKKSAEGSCWNDLVWVLKETLPKICAKFCVTCRILHKVADLLNRHWELLCQLSRRREDTYQDLKEIRCVE
jgi:hypothetical protein